MLTQSDAVILDLPRSERYKEEDVMGLRVIPGTSEPKLYLNSHISNQLSFYALCLLLLVY